MSASMLVHCVRVAIPSRIVPNRQGDCLSSTNPLQSIGDLVNHPWESYYKQATVGRCPGPSEQNFENKKPSQLGP